MVKNRQLIRTVCEWSSSTKWSTARSSNTNYQSSTCTIEHNTQFLVRIMVLSQSHLWAENSNRNNWRAGFDDDMMSVMSRDLRTWRADCFRCFWEDPATNRHHPSPASTVPDSLTSASWTPLIVPSGTRSGSKSSLRKRLRWSKTNEVSFEDLLSVRSVEQLCLHASKIWQSNYLSLALSVVARNCNLSTAVWWVRFRRGCWNLIICFLLGVSISPTGVFLQKIV